MTLNGEGTNWAVEACSTIAEQQHVKLFRFECFVVWNVQLDFKIVLMPGNRFNLDKPKDFIEISVKKTKKSMLNRCAFLLFP